MSHPDLSECYILRKLPDGWMMAHQDDHVQFFVPNSELTRLGYLSPKQTTISLANPISSPVIQVPVAKSKKRNSAPAGNFESSFPKKNLDKKEKLKSLTQTKRKSENLETSSPVISLIS